ncbi:MAG: hypothetical protein LBM74_09405 [Oscillospiraceae bacterium]|nr:hypothetical protein [Oscillospiraceae bacterium]
MQFVDRGGFFFVELGGGIIRRVFERGEVIRIDQNGLILGAMAGGQHVMRARIFNIFNAVSAEHRAPVRLRILMVLIEDVFIGDQRLVKLIEAAKVVRPVE